MKPTYRILFSLALAVIALVVGVAATQAVAPAGQRLTIRQGGSPTDWAIPGTTNYVVTCTLQQGGSITWNSEDGQPKTAGSVFVTYPQSYGGGNTPLVFVNATGAANASVSVAPAPLFAGMHLYWESETPRASVQFAWRTEGPGQNCR
jgi:hypothetical protein